MGRHNPGVDGLRQRTVAWLVRPQLPMLLALVALLVTAPTLWLGWIADDFLQRRFLLQATLPQALAGMFSFVHPDGALSSFGLDRLSGELPWWTAPDLKVSFWRPAAALTHWLDYRLWPDSAMLMHLHSMVWYALACGLAVFFYRSLMGATPAAGLAGLIFALDTVHIGSVAWLANRNGVLSLLFGLGALLAHHAWRRGGQWLPMVASGLCLSLSLLAAESGVAVGGYLLAYALFLDRSSRRRRLFSLLPGGLVCAVWLLVYRLAGYGIRGSAFYLDPLASPQALGLALLERGPVLLVSQWLGQVPSAYNFVAGSARIWIWMTAALVMAGLCLLLWPLLQRSPVARFFMAGMLLSVVPACTVIMLSGRLLLFTGLGAMGLMGAYVGAVLGRQPRPLARPRFQAGVRGLAYLLLVLHVALPPLLVPVAVQAMQAAQRVIEQVTRLDGLVQEGQRVVIVNAPSPFHFIYLPSYAALTGRSQPGPLRVLAPGYQALRLERETPTTFLVEPAPSPDGPRLEPMVHDLHMYRDLAAFFGLYRPVAGAVGPVDLGDLAVEPLTLPTGAGPGRARFRFRDGAEEGDTVWLQWDWASRRYLPFRLPQPGQSVTLAGPVP